MKTYKIVNFCFTGEHPDGAHIETSDGYVYNFPTLQKAEAFSFFLLGLGYTKEK